MKKIDNIKQMQSWLGRAWRIEQEIHALEEAKQREYERVTSATAATVGRVVSTSGDKHKYDKYAGFADRLERRIHELSSVKQEIEEAISRVENSTHRTLLLERYINCKTWERIAVDMNYSYKQICRIHGRALAGIKDVLECPIDKTL